MDGFEFNKIAGAVLAALLVIFGTRTIMDITFKPHVLEKPAYQIALTSTSGKDEGPAKEQPKLAIAELLKAGTVEQGKDVFKKCAACHKSEKGAANAVGPALYDVVNRDVATIGKFGYSDAMKAKGGKWTYEALQAYLYDPKNTIPGNKMAFAGVKANDDLGSIILYLRSLADAPAPLPN